MSYFAVIREAGPTWIDGKSTFEQPGVNDHAAFMNTLADQGFVLFGGPLAGSESGRIRVLLIADATSEDEIENHLRNDPWALTKKLTITSIEPWNIFTGAQRLAQPEATPK
jgi:uncharacterized protein YciI